mgnify:CR=1 FL=1
MNKYEDLTITDPEWDQFSLEGQFTPSQLDHFTDMILRADVRAGNKLKGENPILFQEHIKTRYKREIYNQNGIPDPSIQQGIFYRTHPEGRKVNSEEARKTHGASFYRDISFLSPESEYLIGKDLLKGNFGEKTKIGRLLSRWQE